VPRDYGRGPLAVGCALLRRSPDAFPDAVRATAGFLAGRAIWSTALVAPDTRQALHPDSVSRLTALLDAVDNHARPWSAAGAV
jgi:sulfofructosephosphate aldolase